MFDLDKWQEILSTIPITELAKLLDPPAPAEVTEAISNLKDHTKELSLKTHPTFAIRWPNRQCPPPRACGNRHLEK